MALLYDLAIIEPLAAHLELWLIGDVRQQYESKSMVAVLQVYASATVCYQR